MIITILVAHNLDSERVEELGQYWSTPLAEDDIIVETILACGPVCILM